MRIEYTVYVSASPALLSGSSCAGSNVNDGMVWRWMGGKVADSTLYIPGKSSSAKIAAFTISFGTNR